MCIKLRFLGISAMKTELLNYFYEVKTNRKFFNDIYKASTEQDSLEQNER